MFHTFCNICYKRDFFLSQRSLHRNGKQMYQPLFDTGLQDPIWRNMTLVFCSIWDVWRVAFHLGPKVTDLQPEPVPSPSTQWRTKDRSSCDNVSKHTYQDMQLLLGRAAHKNPRSAETSQLHRCPVGSFGSLRTFSLFAWLFFFYYFFNFRESWRKCSETVEFPECSPSSCRFCTIGGPVTLWCSTDIGLSCGFANLGPARAWGSQTFDQLHDTIGDVASQSQGLHFLVRGYL